MKLINFKGLFLHKKKETVGLDLITMRPMEFYNVPLKLKGIAESEPCVRVGDEVKQGTLIAQPTGKFGINIYSPVSGKVLNIFDKMNFNGEYAKHILIMNNNKGEVQDLPAIESVSDVTLISRLRDAGIVDTISSMPSYLKYAFTGSRSYKNLLILMDCTDPTGSVDQTLAEYRMEEVVNGARYFMNITSATTITFVFTEANYKLATKLKNHINETKKNYDFKIKFIPCKYPFDNPYIIANLVCNKKINKKTSFLDAGITIETAEACYNFCRAVEFNKPVTTKVITVDGDNVLRKGNYLVPNGTSYDNLLEFAGIDKRDAPSSLIEGNLMNGKAQFNKDISITLTTESLLFVKSKPHHDVTEHPCISCGKCAKVCPMLLDPHKIESAYFDEHYDELDKLRVESCVNCGCCSYVCPSKRFLTQRIESAKHYKKKFKGGV